MFKCKFWTNIKQRSGSTWSRIYSFAPGEGRVHEPPLKRVACVYKTIYRLYRPGSSKNRYTIIASHFKDLKKIVVEVNDEQYLITVMTGQEETTYEEPTLKPFGFRGNLAILDKAAPAQLAVQFLSGRYDYVKVLRFLGSSADGIFKFFMFNENDKIPMPRSASPIADNKSSPKAVFHGINGNHLALSDYLPRPSVIPIKNLSIRLTIIMFSIR